LGRDVGGAVGAPRLHRRSANSKRMCFCDPFGDRAVGGEVFGDDAFAAFRRDLAVPDAFGINHHPRAAAADAQAGGFGAHGGNTEIFEAGLQRFPRRETVGGRAAIGADAEKNVTARALDFHFGEAGGDGRIEVRRHERGE
jgi:hypothetical protein